MDSREGREEWCSYILSNLMVEDLRISTLNEIKEHFNSIPYQDVCRTADVLELPLVFDCVNDSNREQVDLACEVLTLCMNTLRLGKSIIKYEVHLERALRHPFPSVKLMALTELERNLHKEESTMELCKRTLLFIGILKCIGDEDISIAKKAIKLISALGTTDLGIRTLVSSNGIEILYKVMSTNNEVVRLRVYEVAVNIAKKSEFNFNLLKSTGIIDNILEEIKSNDILLRMNIIEILIELGLSQHGFIFLEESGVLKEMFTMLDESDDPLTLSLSEPGILKFFGNLAHGKPAEMMLKYPKIFDRLYSNIESSDMTIVKVSLETIGLIGSTNEGKQALSASGDKINFAIKTIVKSLVAFPNQVRLTALSCLENILRVGDQNAEIMDITKKWFNFFGDDPVDVIMRYAEYPFPDIRMSGLGIVLSIASQPWGQEAISNTPGLIEFLLDRNTEIVKECKDIKYEIVKLLAISGVFDESTSSRLQRYVEEGPYHVHAITEIAFETNE